MATTHRARARYSPMDLREQTRLLTALPIVPRDSPSGPTGHSTCPTTFAGEFIGLCTRAIPTAGHRWGLLALAFPPLLAKSFHRPHSLRRVTPRIFPSPRGRRQIWLLSVPVFTTVKWAERVARVATAQTAQAHRSDPI